VRSIIQISTVSSGFFALCDDGTVWGLTANHPNWVRLPDIPQDPVPEERENPVWRWECMVSVAGCSPEGCYSQLSRLMLLADRSYLPVPCRGTP
jgi:hypothetical protein